MFYTVFSTNVSPYMQWQSDLLEYSWKRVEQEGVLIRLVATDDPQNLPSQKYAKCVATRLWDVHPETGDAYPIYNKPASFLEWVYKDKPDGTVLLLDPDCVFRERVTRRVAPGSPASQSWVDFREQKPSAKSPFGLGEKFAFLTKYCTRTNVSINPVMIPTMIHTSDLRKICARWLELCAKVREHYRDGEGHQAWESDMYAYLAACAEYDLQHDPVSLGVCTNWDPADAPDAPLIHYCQSILAKNGNVLFGKNAYQPWSRVDMPDEPAQDYGRDLIKLVNACVDDLQGIVRPPSPEDCPKHCAGVMEGRVIDDMLLELPAEGSKLWLNISGKAIWELCDGSRTIDEIGSVLSDRFAADKQALNADVINTVGQLRATGFLTMR
jgi:hypothetical protein